MHLILATGNAHKAEEFNRMFAVAGLAIRVDSAKIVGGMPKVVEDAGTFEGNALLKARALRALAGPDHWVFSDDSGLCCDALNGAPGVDTAIYAGEHATAAQHRAKLLAAMSGQAGAGRNANFRCHLVLLGPAGEFAEFSGICQGRIAERETGAGGFGYDPVFIPHGHDKTFAELDPSIKDRLSHRALAFEKLAAHLDSLISMRRAH